MIKLLIFDLSNTCFNLEEPPYLIKFCERHNIDHDAFEADYQELLVRAEVDEIQGKDVWTKLLKKYNIDTTPEAVIKEMMELKEGYDETLEYINSLREKYTIVYLTNYNKDYWDEIAKKFDMNKWFDFGVVSYQVKARKPSVIGFKFILDKYGVKPEEAMFTDDVAKNLTQAKEMGINTLQFTNLGEFKEELKKLSR